MERYTSAVLPVLTMKDGVWTVRAVLPGTLIKISVCVEDPQFALVTLDGETFHALLQDVQERAARQQPRRGCGSATREFRATSGS